MPKVLRLFLEKDSPDASIVPAALSLAETFGACLTIAVTAAIPYYELTAPAAAGSEPYAQARQILAADAMEVTAQVKARVASSAVATQVHTLVEGLSAAADQVSTWARYADLNIMPSLDGFRDAWPWRLMIEGVLFHSGRPLMVLPANAGIRKLESVVLAWNATAVANRALHDAMAFLSPGARIHVLILDGKPTRRGHGAEPGADIAQYIAHHGFEASVESIRSEGQPMGALLQEAVEKRGAHALVMGGYGHARWREIVFGGVTREVLDRTRVPIFLSH